MSLSRPEEKEFLLRCPFTMLISGAHSSGKSTFVKRLLDKAGDIFDRGASEKVYFFYRQWQSMFDRMPGVEFIEGLPTKEWASRVLGGRGDDGPSATVVIDDQGSDLNSEIADMFTVTAHHSNTSFLVIVHSLFGRTPAHRLISLNCTYLVIAKVRERCV